MEFNSQKTMRVSLGRCIICYFVIFALLSCLAVTATSLEVSQGHNTTHAAPELIRRYNVVSSERYRDDCLRTGKMQRVPAIFWTSFPTENVPMNEQGYLSAVRWARGFFGSRDAFVTYDSVSDT